MNTSSSPRANQTKTFHQNTKTESEKLPPPVIIEDVMDFKDIDKKLSLDLTKVQIKDPKNNNNYKVNITIQAIGRKRMR